jgi:hypothetical protein
MKKTAGALVLAASLAIGAAWPVVSLADWRDEHEIAVLQRLQEIQKQQEEKEDREGFKLKYGIEKQAPWKPTPSIFSTASPLGVILGLLVFVGGIIAFRWRIGPENWQKLRAAMKEHQAAQWRKTREEWRKLMELEMGRKK